MGADERHLTVAECIQLYDGEMGAADALAAGNHLSHCHECRLQMENIDVTSQTLNETRQTLQMRSDDHQQARLRLVAEQKRIATSGILNVSSFSWPKAFLCVSVGLIFIFFAGLKLRQYALSRDASAYVQEKLLPNPQVTPGDVQSVSVSDICPARDEDKDPPIPARIQQAVFDEYGVSAKAGREQFQLDYLISPQLGGTSNLRNLWPQSYQSAVWNAYAKDELEEHLHNMVCDHKIGLAQAQREIADNWIRAYQKYFQTQIPAPRQALLRLPTNR